MTQEVAHPLAVLGNATTSSANGEAWHTWLLLAGILLFTAILYWPALGNGFTNLDDDVYVTQNQDLPFNGKNLHTLTTKEVAGNFHPVTMWSLSSSRGTDAKQAPDPLPFHRTNLLLHLFNTALTFYLGRRLRFGVWASALAALFFAIHPLHVESVAWVSGRKDVLYAAFFLSGLIAYTRARTGHVGAWVGVFVLFVMACLSKPAAIVFPLVLLLEDWYLSRQEGQDGATLWAVAQRNLKWLVPMLCLAAVFSVLTLRYQQHVGAVAVHYSFWHRCLFAAYGLVVYPVKLFLPFQLVAMHPAPDPTDPLGPVLMGAPLLALALLGAGIWAYRKHTTWFFALAFYGLNVLLVLGFIKVGSALYAERYTYLAYTGIFLALGATLERLWAKTGAGKMAALATALVLAGLFAVQTRRQIPVWKNSETLWSQIIGYYPTPVNLSYRGYHYYLSQQYDKALADFDRAAQQRPNDATTTHIRALCLEKLGRLEDAWNAYSAYEKQFPFDKDVAFHTGNCLMALQRYEAAITRYERVIAADPNHLDAWNNQANALFSLKQYEAAEQAFTKTLALNPNFLTGLNNRGAARLNLGKWSEAVADFTQSLAKDPSQGQIFRYRSMAFEKLNRHAEAAVDRAEAAKREK